MTDSVVKSNPTDALVELVSVALSQNKLSGHSEMLKTIAKAMNAHGCVLWEVAPGSDLKAVPPKGYLFVLDQWLEDGRQYVLYNLPLEGSAVGWAVLNQQSYNIADAFIDRNISTNPHYVEELNIKTAALAPLTFSDNVRKGALMLMRQAPDPFTEEEIRQIETFALLVPSLYQSTQVKVIFDLTRRVNEELQRAKPITSNGEPLINAMRKPLAKICNLIKKTFQCVETSIFLKESGYHAGSFKKAATTWPWGFPKVEYKNNEKGLTGWVLGNNQSVRIFDLANFERDKAAIQATYPKIEWTDSLNIKVSIRKIFKLNDKYPLPPLSFMAAPIALGNEVLGVIRCCAAQGGTKYFDNRDLELLGLIADQIGQYWSRWLSEAELKEENDVWRALVEKIGKLNKFVLTELTTAEPSEKRIFAEALQVMKSSIKGGDAVNIRLVNKSQELYFDETLGEAWDTGTSSEIKQRRQITFPLNERPARSVGARVFQSGRVYLVKGVRKDGVFAESLLFSNVKRILTAPIKVADEALGVLDIFSTEDRSFPKNAEGIAELMGQQIGLYKYLANTISDLRKAETDLKKQVEERSQMMEDLAHQLRSPIHLARARTQFILRSESDERRLSHLQAVSGLCAKARRVTTSMKLSATLARNEPIEANPANLQYDILIKMLIEAARDNEWMTDPARRISIHVNRDSFKVPRLHLVKADYNLLEQAISNLLDNAIKYGFDNEEIQIYGKLQDAYLHISVVNRGLKISAVDVHQCIKRGWRSGDALMVTGEGSGIGLWIVQGIMDAHRGRLDIIPTTSDGRTEVRLVLPQREERT